MAPTAPSKQETKAALRALIRLGYTRSDIARELLVSERSIGNWICGVVVPRRRSFSELRDLVKRENGK